MCARMSAWSPGRILLVTSRIPCVVALLEGLGERHLEVAGDGAPGLLRQIQTPAAHACEIRPRDLDEISAASVTARSR